MLLSELLKAVPAALPPGAKDPEISGVTCDSREVRPGTLFVAVRGALQDGHEYLEAAARGGALACLVERPVPGHGMISVPVTDAEAALGRVSSAFWGHPSRKLRLVGITGTNGKTTTAYLVQHILRSLGMEAGRLGTISYAYPRGEEPAPLTTPDAVRLQRALARMVEEGARAVVAEVSSHALERARVEGCFFACAAFTNQTQDHLDYHGTMEAYFEAKRLLFTRYATEAPAAINAEDPFGRRLLADLGDRAVAYGVRSGEVRFEVSSVAAGGIAGRVHHPGGSAPLTTPLTGAFNTWNVACAVAIAWALELDVTAACASLSTAPQVPGRVEAVANDLGFGVYVDYAHTPDALNRVLETVRGVCAGRLIGVFGCGGDRDRGKRPLMAQAAARWCDALVLTADNSRSESTDRILDEIASGLPPGWSKAGDPHALKHGTAVWGRTPDRAEAIRWAVEAAQAGDGVVIAGKGHETTQNIGGRVTPFDDREEARAALRERAA